MQTKSAIRRHRQMLKWHLESTWRSHLAIRLEKSLGEFSTAGHGILQVKFFFTWRSFQEVFERTWRRLQAGFEASGFFSISSKLLLLILLINCDYITVMQTQDEKDKQALVQDFCFKATSDF